MKKFRIVTTQQQKKRLYNLKRDKSIKKKLHATEKEELKKRNRQRHQIDFNTWTYELLKVVAYTFRKPKTEGHTKEHTRKIFRDFFFETRYRATDGKTLILLHS